MAAFNTLVVMAKPPTKIEQLVEQLQELSKLVASEQPANIPPSRVKLVRQVITDSYERLRHTAEKLDPIKHPGFIFDPTNPNVVGRIVGITLIALPRKPLAQLERFYGSGVYALYYIGDFSLYADVSKREHPIYVGKADPVDPASKTVIQQGDRLSNRLNDHRRTVMKADSTLRLEDFEYRALAVQTGWQNAAEEYLIHLFRPIWNNEVGICYGFGKHGDAPETRANLRSPWDTLHPGRKWAHRDTKMKDAKPKEQIAREIREHFKKYPTLKSVDEILRKFLEEIRSVT